MGCENSNAKLCLKTALKALNDKCGEHSLATCELVLLIPPEFLIICVFQFYQDECTNVIAKMQMEINAVDKGK